MDRVTHGLKKFNNYEVIADPNGAYVLVELTKGQWATCDIDDWFGGINRTKWCAMWNRYTRSFYAYGRLEGEKGKCAMMHRLILGVQGRNPVDHRDHDTLCNRRHNIRACSQSENGRNRKGPPRNNKSGYLGVCWDGHRGKWRSEIRINNVTKHIGLFDSAIEAAVARDEKAKEIHGEFAFLNFIGHGT